MPRSNHLSTLVAKAISRRDFLKAGSAFAATGFLGGCATSTVAPATIGNKATASYAFKGVPVSNADNVVVAEGYAAKPFYLFGDPVSDGPQWKFGGANTSDEAMEQAGQMHDGMWFFPLPVGSNNSDHGLLVMNHEYPDAKHAFPDGDKNWSAEKVRKLHAVVGVSVIEVKKVNGDWQVIRPSKYARRIHGLTPMTLSGPAAGTDLMKSGLDPAGREAVGTMGNCANGLTPWGTYLTCEENFHYYFAAPKRKVNKMEARYGLDDKTRYPHWQFDERHDSTRHPNEFNKVGWVVEIDPFDPLSKPVKRTAIGRCRHESAYYAIAKDGRVVIYTGDDSRFEYVYKFVTRDKWNPSDRKANMDLLDHGTLYVARYKDGGKGEWIELAAGKNGLTAEKGFPSQAEVVTFARAAGDLVGATQCDRPEWIVVQPKTGEVYASFTGNKDRGTTPGKNGKGPANPRDNNIFGHIVRWREAGGDAAATTFDWDVFVNCGDPAHSNPALRGDINGDSFTNPDGLTFDYRGNLWIVTDTAEATDAELAFRGNDAMLAADTQTRETRRFLTGPIGCEVTGLCFTPDDKTAFVNIQHPTDSWPNKARDGQPRTATLAITKNDGGVIGS